MSNYVSSSTGAYGGYSSVATAEKWRIDGNGGIYTQFHATSSSTSSGTYQVNEKTLSTLKVDPDGTLTIIRKKGDGATALYVIRGWAVTPDISVLKLNGPYYESIPSRVKTEPGYAHNLDAYWVRPNAAPAK